MRVKKINCPYCDAVIDSNIQGRSSVFCSYCGQQIFLDNEKREFTYNKNVNINKTNHNIYTDEAEVIRAKTEAEKDKRDLISFAAIMGTLLLIAVLCFTIPALVKAGNKNSGKIIAGYYQDLVGEDYKTVEAHFKAAGFKNIELIDLDDSGIAFWNDGKVETISVGGNTSFDSYDYFDPETKVIISYH